MFMVFHARRTADTLAALPGTTLRELHNGTKEVSMSTRERDRIRRALPVAVLAIGLTPAVSIGAESCGVPLDDVKAKISGFSNRTDSEGSGVQKDFEAATSKDYVKKYFDRFDQLNKSAKDATQLVNTGYNLAGYTSPLAEGKVQSALPPKVTLSMSNAVELAQAAADEDKTKLDIAELRCNQNTEDAALSAALQQLDSSTVNKFQAAKKKACKIVHVTADLQDKKRKLDDLRTNGYSLFHLQAKDKKDFAGKKRTVQIRADLRLYPEYPKSVDPNGKDQQLLLGKIEGIDLSYNSYFKWSDDNWTKLNLYQYFIGDTQKGEICQPQLKLSSSVKVATCVSVTDVKTDYIKVKVRGKYWYNGGSGAVSIGEQKIPAPFGYLADISDMKDKKMQSFKSKAVNHVAALMGDYGDMLKKAQQWKDSCGH